MSALEPEQSAEHRREKQQEAEDRRDGEKYVALAVVEKVPEESERRFGGHRSEETHRAVSAVRLRDGKPGSTRQRPNFTTKNTEDAEN